jgi:hypothetical protein
MDISDLVHSGSKAGIAKTTAEPAARSDVLLRQGNSIDSGSHLSEGCQRPEVGDEALAIDAQHEWVPAIS